MTGFFRAGTHINKSALLAFWIAGSQPGNDRQRRLLAREEGDEVGVVALGATLEDRGTAGGSTTGVHISTIRVSITLALFITTSTPITTTA